MRSQLSVFSLNIGEQVPDPLGMTIEHPNRDHQVAGDLRHKENCRCNHPGNKGHNMDNTKGQHAIVVQFGIIDEKFDFGITRQKERWHEK
ncbi:MAG: hypothetical protein ACR2QF_07695 [Geminicoccaceae bacterium]